MSTNIQRRRKVKLQTNLNREDVVTAKVVTVKQTGTKHKASGQLSLTGKYAKKMKYIDIRSNFVSKLGVKDKCADSCDAFAKIQDSKSNDLFSKENLQYYTPYKNNEKQITIIITTIIRYYP